MKKEKHLKSIFVLWSLLIMGMLGSAPIKAMEEYEYPDDENKKHAIAALVNLRKDNDKFVHEHANGTYFNEFLNVQHPRMTCVMCVDSRVHHHAFDLTPDNDIYTVRNLSGQYAANSGAILYGVKHMKTPLLVVMGHDDCGAVTAKTKLECLSSWDTCHPQEEKNKAEKGKSAASENSTLPAKYQYLIKWKDELEKEIIEELSAVNIARASIPSVREGDERFKYIVHQNIKFNIHQQVDQCLSVFYDKVRKGQLIIAGALYDFQGQEGEGRGKLIWLDARDKKNVDTFVIVDQSGTITTSYPGVIRCLPEDSMDDVK